MNTRPILVLLLAGSALAAPAGNAVAQEVPAPGATCADANFFDGLDTRYAATYCYNATSARGWAAQKLTNTEATDALPNLPRDAIFYHAGHALVVGPTSNNVTAVASAFAGPTSTSTTYTGLLGDPQAATLQGPTQVCSSGGGCRDVTMVNYPHVTEMTKFNLAVFQSCESARDGAYGYTSLATLASQTALVGTAIGFVTPVAWIRNSPGNNVAGDAFARRFWGDLRNGTDYKTALVAAVNAAGGSTYGYSGYRYLHRAGAPVRLSPPSYYVPA